MKIVVRRTDGTESVWYAYGKLGEVASETREITRLGSGGVEPVKRAEMRYAGDYLGWMEEIGYGDGGGTNTITGARYGR
jgi:hypothetical protein